MEKMTQVLFQYRHIAILALLCFSASFLLRLFWLDVPVSLNVDEAQWTVSARRILSDPVVWRSNDLQTSGPLNGIVISWPYLIGSIPSLMTSRLTGFILQGASLLGMVLLIRPSDIFGFGTAAALTATTMLALTADPGYNHYSSEDLSLFLIVLFCVSFVGLNRAPRSAWRWAVCGLVATSLPLAKLQSAPFCLLFHGVCLGRLIFDMTRRRAGWREALVYVAGSVLPALALIVPPFLVGEQDAVLKGYFQLGMSYGSVAGHGAMAAGTHRAARGHIGNSGRPFYIFWEIIPLVLVWVAMMVGALIRRRGYFQARWDVLLLAVGLWLAVFLSVWLPGHIFAHYRLYAFIGLPLAIVLAERALAPIPGRPFLLIPLLAPVAVMIVFMLPLRQQAVAAAASEAAFASPATAPNSRALYDWTGVTPNDALLMWGWEPELTAYAGVKSADRAAIAEYMIRANPGRDYFRGRLLRAIASAKPSLVIDTNRPGYFFVKYPDYNPAAADLRSFPQLYRLVQADYDPVGGGGACATLYMRRDLVKALRAAEIPLRSTAPALVDGSTTEKCGDWWAPSPAASTAELSLQHPEPIGNLWILASRGGEKRDRGSTWVEVTFITPSGEQSAQSVHLFDYPRWTVISGPDGRAISSIRLTTTRYVGTGPALSEVKAFRAPSWRR